MPIKKESNTASRRILVHGDTDFILEVPADIRMTFGPWSPPSEKERMNRYGEKALCGTLRLYKGAATTNNIVAMYTNVQSFRDLDAIKYEAQHALPICHLCNNNLVEPGDDLCTSCNGHAQKTTIDKSNKTLVF